MSRQRQLLQTMPMAQRGAWRSGPVASQGRKHWGRWDGRRRGLLALLVLTSFLTFMGCNSGNNDGGIPAQDNPPAQNNFGTAFVLTTDFSTGSYAAVDVATQAVQADIVPGGVSSDSLARAFNGQIYVVNRSGGSNSTDNIQRIDPQAGFTTPAGAQLSVGPGTNPQDIALVRADKAYVSRLASAELLIINPTTLTETGSIDLSALADPADTDGIPEPFLMLVHDGLVYVLLQHLDTNQGFIAVASGDVVVIDPDTDGIVAVISLQGRNPFADLQFSSALNRILVSSVGEFFFSNGVSDGGIEAINPETLAVNPEFIITEGALGGDITHFAVVSATQGFAVVADAAFNTALVSFNPSTGEAGNTLAVVEAGNGFISHFAINRVGELYLSIPDTTTATPGLRIFDIANETEVTTTPLRVGDLPPNWVVFLQE